MERPLCIALQFRHWEAARFLLNKKCDVTKKQKWDRTPLHIAAASGSPETILVKLLKLGADIQAIDSSDDTPLCQAAEAVNGSVLDIVHSAAGL